MSFSCSGSTPSQLVGAEADVFSPNIREKNKGGSGDAGDDSNRKFNVSYLFS